MISNIYFDIKLISHPQSTPPLRPENIPEAIGDASRNRNPLARAFVFDLWCAANAHRQSSSNRLSDGMRALLILMLQTGPLKQARVELERVALNF